MEQKYGSWADFKALQVLSFKRPYDSIDLPINNFEALDPGCFNIVLPVSLVSLRCRHWPLSRIDTSKGQNLEELQVESLQGLVDIKGLPNLRKLQINAAHMHDLNTLLDACVLLQTLIVRSSYGGQTRAFRIPQTVRVLNLANVSCQTLDLGASAVNDLTLVDRSENVHTLLLPSTLCRITLTSCHALREIRGQLPNLRHVELHRYFGSFDHKALFNRHVQSAILERIDEVADLEECKALQHLTIRQQFASNEHSVTLPSLLRSLDVEVTANNMQLYLDQISQLAYLQKLVIWVPAHLDVPEGLSPSIMASIWFGQPSDFDAGEEDNDDARFY